jgi:YVTN family beta-propeller protein
VKLKLALLLLAGISATTAPLPAEAQTASTPADTRIYVGNSIGDDIAVIDIASMKMVDDIKVGLHPHGVAVTPDGRRLFVTIESNNTLRVIDTATDKVISTIALTGRPNQCAVTPDGRYVAVPIRNRDSVDIVDAAKGTVVKTLPVKAPHNSFDAGSNRYIFVSSMGSDEIDMIDLKTLTYAAEIPVGGVPRPYVVTRDGRTIYVALSNLHGFVIVDIPNKRVVDRVVMPAVHKQPHPHPYEPIDTLTHGLALSPNGRELWVTSLLDDCIYIYDVLSKRIVGSVKTGDGPNWVTFSPDGKYVAVSNADSDDVSIFDVSQHHEVARVKTGRVPKRLIAAIAPVTAQQTAAR